MTIDNDEMNHSEEADSGLKPDRVGGEESVDETKDYPWLL